MAYSPVEWNTGDVITAAKLNNMERGIINNESVLDEIGGTEMYNSTITVTGGTTRLNLSELDEGVYLISEIVTVNKALQAFSVTNVLNNAQGAVGTLYHTQASSNYGSINHTFVVTVGEGGGSVTTNVLLPGSAESTTASITGSVTKLK